MRQVIFVKPCRQRRFQTEEFSNIIVKPQETQQDLGRMETYGVSVESRTYLRYVGMDIAYAIRPQKYCTKFPYKDYFCPYIGDEISAGDSAVI